MLEIQQKESALFRVKPLANENGELIRESKPFRSDNKPREFITVELFMKKEKDADGEVALGKESDVRIVKNLWSHRHTKTFNYLADLIEEGSVDKEGFIIGAKLWAVDYKLPCDQYYVYGPDGQKRKTVNGDDVIGRHVRFVLLDNENSSVQEEYRLATADLPYVGADDLKDKADEKAHEETETAPPVASGRRRG